MASHANAKQKSPATIWSGLFWLLTRIGLPLLLLYGLLWWRADAAIDRQLDKMRSVVNIQRGSTVLGLNGDVGMRNVRVTPVDGAPLPALTLRAQRAVVQTPGLWWLVRSSLFGVPEEIPSRVGLRLDGVSIDGDEAELDKAMIGGHVIFPFDLAACDTPLTYDVLRALGGAEAQGSFQATMTHPSPTALRWDVVASSPGLVDVAGDLQMAIGGSGDMRLRFATSAFQSLQVVYTDRGFVKSRNDYCQKRTGLDAAQFNARHVDAAGRSFASHGVKPGAAWTQSYAGFSRDGGSLTIAARPQQPLPLPQLAGVNLENAAFLLNASVRHNDASPGALSFLPADPGVVQAVAFSARDIPTNAARDLSISSPRVAIGEQIPYADLAAYVGDEVQVTTSMNTTRRAILQGTNLMGVSLKASAAEGGYTLSVPKHTIVNVVLVASAAADVATGSPNAQTH